MPLAISTRNIRKNEERNDRAAPIAKWVKGRQDRARQSGFGYVAARELVGTTDFTV
jgi:hypothetical protein